MKYRPEKDFQLEYMQFLSVLLFPTDWVTVLLYQKHLLPSKNQ